MVRAEKMSLYDTKVSKTHTMDSWNPILARLIADGPRFIMTLFSGERRRTDEFVLTVLH